MESETDSDGRTPSCGKASTRSQGQNFPGVNLNVDLVVRIVVLGALGNFRVQGVETMPAMTQAERQRVTEYLAETQAQVLQIVQNLSERQLDFKIKPSQRSISQTLEHLSAVDSLTGTLIEEALGKPPGLKESAWKDRDDALLDQVRNRVVPLKAPEVIQPSEATDHDDVFRWLKESRQRLLASPLTPTHR